MNSSRSKIIIFCILGLASIVMINGSEKNKREYKNLLPLSDVSRQLADEDLEAGLKCLSSNELRTLSGFIDEESKSLESNSEGQIRNSAKKKRTIDDLYDELAHENAELDFKQENQNDPSKTFPNDGKCHCKELAQREESARKKRNNLKANTEEERKLDNYFTELENSFPREKSANINNGEMNVPKCEHIRVKRF